ncbi:amidase, partial [Rhizobium leguminosarum]
GAIAYLDASMGLASADDRDLERRSAPDRFAARPFAGVPTLAKDLGGPFAGVAEKGSQIGVRFAAFSFEETGTGRDRQAGKG